MRTLIKTALIALVVAGFFMAVHAADAQRGRVANLTEAYNALGQQYYGVVQLPCNLKMF